MKSYASNLLILNHKKYCIYIALILRALSALQIDTGFDSLRVLESPLNGSHVLAQIGSRLEVPSV